MPPINRLHNLLRLACKSGNGYPAERQNALERAISHAQKHSIDILRVIGELGVDLEGLCHAFGSNFPKRKGSVDNNIASTPQAERKNKYDNTYWSVKSGVVFKVPYVVNPRWASSRRRYRDNEVIHGFPVNGLKEFFFYSSCIVSAGYDPCNRILFLKLSSRSMYRYINVPESVVKSLIDSPSYGVFARRHIFYSYHYERVVWQSFR